MTTGQGGSKRNVSQEDYDVRYYGYEKEIKVLESRISELEQRNKSLEWKNRTLTILTTIFLLILFIGTLTMTTLNALSSEKNHKSIEKILNLQKQQGGFKLKSIEKISDLQKLQGGFMVRMHICHM